MEVRHVLDIPIGQYNSQGTSQAWTLRKQVATAHHVP